MTDKELLERAAMAAGMEVGFESGQWFWCEHGPRGTGMYQASSGYTHWNPLTDDGDALRLAVKLGIALHHDDADSVMAGLLRQQRVPFTIDGFGSWFWKECLRDNSGDRSAATRRAITRAAAAMAQTPRSEHQ